MLPAPLRRAAAAVAARVAARRPPAAPAARRPVHLITSCDQCQAVVERILSSGRPSVGVDCEGSQLGRFGRLGLVQLATDEEVFLIDVAVGGPRLVAPLSPLLESRELVKVFHDCREDVSLLLHQYSTRVAAVSDTQVGFSLWLERRGLETFQASVAEVLRTFRLEAYRAHRWDELERKALLAARWQTRPLDPQAIRYAVEGVAHLMPLQRAICRELGDPAGDLVVQRSARYLEYAHLNSAELPSTDLSGLRPGAPLGAMLASRRPGAAYFKLNHGLLTGAALDPKDLCEFEDLIPGDVASCRVKALSDCRQFVHLRREGHGSLAFDMRSQTMRRLPTQEQLDQAHTPRPSSFYGFGAPAGPRTGFREEPDNFRERKPDVVFKRGKRGVLKVRDTAIRTPPPRRRAGDWRPEPSQRSAASAGASGGGRGGG